MGVDKTIKTFEQQFKTTPHVLVKAPGRINLIGEHTDYNKGFVLPAAIDRYMNFAIGENGHSYKCILHASDLDATIEISLKDPRKSEQDWANYFIGILLQLGKMGKKLSGIDLVFGGDIPIGAGLSSSSALECGFLKGINELFKLQLSNKEIITISHKSNHEFLGLQGGIMDHFTILHGKKDHAILLNCDTLDFEYVPLDLGDFEIVLIDSKVSHNLINTGYNDRVAECKRALEIIQMKYPKVEHLSMVDDQILNDTRADMSSLIFRRAKFIKEENERVHQFRNLLKIRNLIAVGSLLYASHEGLRNNYEVSCVEMDLLVELARSSEHILGARMTGGGFGGCTINLIRKEQAKEVSNELLSAYCKKVSFDGKVYFVDITNGVEVFYT